MARYIGPVCKLCRREGIKLFLKGEKCFIKCTLDKRPNPPGSSAGVRAKRRAVSAYSLRLREKQKLKRMAAVLERQMERYFEGASKVSGRTGETMLRTIETRLDSVLRKVGLATSINFARQLVTHGHIKVNNQPVNIPSYNVKPGDSIAVSSKMKENFYVKLSLESFGRRGSVVPSWVSWDPQNLQAQILRLPEPTEFTLPVNDQYIVEFYTRR